MEDNHPFFEVAAAAEAKVREGYTIHQKFTCSRCHSRQTMAEPNTFFQIGTCEECGASTNILVTGCNYVAMFIGEMPVLH
jgi:transcription elongation factor Elf1